MQDMFWNFTIRLRMAAAVAMLVGTSRNRP